MFVSRDNSMLPPRLTTGETVFEVNIAEVLFPIFETSWKKHDCIVPIGHCCGDSGSFTHGFTAQLGSYFAWDDVFWYPQVTHGKCVSTFCSVSDKFSVFTAFTVIIHSLLHVSSRQKLPGSTDNGVLKQDWKWPKNLPSKSDKMLMTSHWILVQVFWSQVGAH